MIVIIKKRCLHFENLNVHLVSHHILISFVSTQWPDIFCKLQSVYLWINYSIYCMQTEMLALKDE